MSITSPEVTMGRIKSATEQSPIAVFVYASGDINTVFSDTIKTREIIETRSYECGEYVGSFHKGLNKTLVM